MVAVLQQKRGGDDIINFIHTDFLLVIIETLVQLNKQDIPSIVRAKCSCQGPGSKFVSPSFIHTSCSIALHTHITFRCNTITIHVQHISSKLPDHKSISTSQVSKHIPVKKEVCSAGRIRRPRLLPGKLELLFSLAAAAAAPEPHRDFSLTPDSRALGI